MVKRVAIDGGHGGSGSTPGKRTPDGEYEWNFNDKVVKACINVLKASGVDVLRTDDASGKTDVPLKDRTNKANSWGADVYVSVHHNALKGEWFDHGAGIETYTYLGSQPESEKLAKCIHPKYVKAMGLRDRGIKKANLHIVRETKMPAVLTEGGFMDSRVDIKAMRDDSKLKAQGEAIAEGILEYLGVKKSSPSKDTSKPSTPSKPSPSKPSSPSSGSIVDYLNSKGVDSSFSNRKRLAEANGISNYTGTAKQNTDLLNKLKRSGNTSTSKPKPKKPTPKGDQKTNSVVDYLNSINQDSSFSNRKRLAEANGISNYKGTASQNTQLLNKLRGGNVSTSKPKPKPKPKPKGDQKTSSVVDYLKSINQDSSFSNRSKLAKKYGINNYKGTASQNAQLLKKLRGR